MYHKEQLREMKKDSYLTFYVSMLQKNTRRVQNGGAVMLRPTAYTTTEQKLQAPGRRS